jgi:putative transposase
MMVVDPVMRLPVGRPWMTVAIDKYTRMIVGIYTSFNPPSTLSVMQCLRHAIKPKTYVSKLYPEIKNTWDTYGIFEGIVLDNAPEFYSTDLEDACLQLGISIQYAPPKRGQYKGSVERFFRTQNQQLLHGQPGTTFSNIIDREDYDPKKNAVISADALDEMTHIFIVDVYHQRVHRGLNDTPASVWAQASAEFPPSLPSRPTDLDVILGCIEHRTISASGIELHGLSYNSDSLARLRRELRSGERVMLKYDPGDLSIIHVADKTNGLYVAVPALNQEYAEGLSLWQHKFIKKYVREVLRRSVDVVALCLAKERIQRIVEREWLSTKKTTTRG